MNSSDTLAQKVKGLASSTEKIVSTGKEHQNYIISLQLILFGFQDGKFTVVNYCHNEKHYQSLVNNYFNKAENKSLLNIIRIPEDDTWYSERSDKNKVFQKRPFLEYELYNNVPAKFDSEIIRHPKKKKKQKAFIKSQKYWDNWCDLIFNSIYGKEAFSCFMKKLVIPLDKNKNRYLYTGLTFSFTNRINHTQISLLSNECYEFLNNLSFDYLIPNLYNNLSLTATRAAISQVMARNMSHNIGSHVMNKLTGNLEKYPIYSTESYDSFGMNLLYKEKFRRVREEKKLFEDKLIEPVLENEILLDQISTFNNYVKCRMDYLSDVTFGTPLMQTNKKVFGELFNDLDKVRMLLNNISGLSDFKYSIKFVRTNYNENGEEPKIVDLDVKNDFPVEMPNDLLGCQAFYNIIENVIRNTAKHNQNKVKTDKGEEESTGKTVFTVNIHTHIPIKPEKVSAAAKDKNIDEKEILETLDLLNTMYMVEIYDNLPVIEKPEKETIAEYIKEVDPGKRPEDIKSVEGLVYKQNKKINTSILQENNALRTHALGIIEMEASAAYLRKMEITDFDGDDYDVDYSPEKRLTKQLKLPVLKAIEKDGSLGYRFFLHKPQEILLVGDFDITENEEVVKKLLQDGVWIKTKKDFEDELITGKVYNHPFVLYKDKNTEDLIKEYRTALSTRTLHITHEKLDELNSLLCGYTEFLRLELFIWEWWCSVYEIDFKFVYFNDTTKQKNQFRIYLMDHFDQDLWKQANDNNIDYIESLSTFAQRKLPNNNYSAFSDYLAAGLNYNNYSTEENFIMHNPGENYEKSFVNRYKIIDSSYEKICVVDERIQEFAKKEKMTDIFKKSEIFIPDEMLNLSQSNYDKEIINNIQKFITDEIKDCKFLLIHYSILERMGQDNIDSNLLKYQEMNPDIHIVITSGRGRPQSLPKHVRFVNLSPVLAAFTEIKCKYLIYNLLNSSRK